MTYEHVQVQKGRIAQWVAPSGAFGRPYEVFEGDVAQVALEVTQLPQDEALAAQLLRAAAQQLDPRDRGAFSLRFLLDPANIERKLRLFVLCRAAAPGGAVAAAAAARIAEGLARLFGEDLPTIPHVPVHGEADPTDLSWVQSMVEVRRTELVAPSCHEPSMTGFAFSYALAPLERWRAGEALELWSRLRTSARSAPLMVEYTFTTADDVSAVELDAAAALAAHYAKWGGGVMVEIPGGVFSESRTVECSPDRAAAGAAGSLRQAAQELADSPVVSYAVRLFSGERYPPVAAAEDLVSHHGLSDRLCLQPIRCEEPTFPRCLDASRGLFATPSARADIWQREGAPAPLARLHRLWPVSRIGDLVPVLAGTGREVRDLFGTASSGAEPVTLAEVLTLNPRTPGDSDHGLSIPFAWRRDAAAGASSEDRTVSLQFGDSSVHALLGGKTGSGKSVLLHDVIVAAAHLYSPDELSMVLIDLKQGVEFGAYRRLPHAKVLAVEGEAEFTVNVLAWLVEEMDRRNDLFDDVRVRDFAAYRRLGGEKLPRILLIVDEFQTLFEERGQGDPLPREAVRELERVATKGRSAGVHMLLSTQSYTWEGGTWLSEKTKANATIRVAMQLADLRQAHGLLAKNAEEVEQLEVAGEGLLEDPALGAGSPVPFRALFQDNNEDFEQLMASKVDELSEAHGDRRPYVFEGRRRPSWGAVMAASRRSDLVFGQALDATGSLVGFDLEGYNQAAHLLVCGARQDELARLVFGLCVQFLQRHGPDGGRVLLGSAYAFPPTARAALDGLRQWAGARIEVALGEPAVAAMIQQCATTVAERAAAAVGDAPPLLFVPFGFNNLTCLTSTAYPAPPERELFSTILRTGAPSSVFVLAATASWPAVSDLLNPEEMGTFGARIGLTLPDATRVVNAYDAFIELSKGYAVAHFPVESPGWVRFRTFPGKDVEAWLSSATPIQPRRSP